MHDGLTNSFDFVWWNLESFSHYDSSRVHQDRWPDCAEAYQSKRDRVENALRVMITSGIPSVVAFAEITCEAARDIRDRILTKFHLHSLDDGLSRSDHQISMMYDPKLAANPGILIAPNMPRGTRPTATVDVCWTGHRLRIYACHWPARFENEQSQDNRRKLARFLCESVYEFLLDTSPNEERHVLIMGDFNAEPYHPEMHTSLNCRRDRAFARTSLHYVDRDTKRPRLYNSGWRLLGETKPFFAGEKEPEVAGTLYWAQKNRWATFDQVIVDGSLIQNEHPFLDERHLEILNDPAFLDPKEAKPMKFGWENGHGIGGVSDHLPIRGRIVLSKESKHD